MKTIDWSRVGEGPRLVLMSAEEVVPGLEMKMADFRDTHALYYAPLRAWIGLSAAGLELGGGPPDMEDGVWYVRRDPSLSARHRDVEPDPKDIVLRRIG